MFLDAFLDAFLPWSCLWGPAIPNFNDFLPHTLSPSFFQASRSPAASRNTSSSFAVIVFIPIFFASLIFDAPGFFPTTSSVVVRDTALVCVPPSLSTRSCTCPRVISSNFPVSTRCSPVSGPGTSSGSNSSSSGSASCSASRAAISTSAAGVSVAALFARGLRFRGGAAATAAAADPGMADAAAGGVLDFEWLFWSPPPPLPTPPCRVFRLGSAAGAGISLSSSGPLRRFTTETLDALVTADAGTEGVVPAEPAGLDGAGALGSEGVAEEDGAAALGAGHMVMMLGPGSPWKSGW
mmetsp:Transcript_21919/g.54144  ORF Transcript_21919/g.54144 Transcript_21919/m.54144 type:complete len:295 (+) Transcript_21919:359-1243(+)